MAPGEIAAVDRDGRYGSPIKLITQRFIDADTASAPHAVDHVADVWSSFITVRLVVDLSCQQEAVNGWLSSGPWVPVPQPDAA